MTQSKLIDAPAQDLALLVRIGPRLHAVPVASVEEVLPALTIEPVGQAKPHVKGVIFVRGHIIPVIDAAARLGLDACRDDWGGHLVCLRVDDRLVALDVDEALDLADLALGTRMSVHGLAGGEGTVSAVVDLEGHMIHVLDPDRLLAEDEAVS